MYFVPQPHLDYERQSEVNNKLHFSYENIQTILNNIQTKKFESYDCVFHFGCISLDKVGADHF